MCIRDRTICNYFEALATKNRLRILDSFGLQEGEAVRFLPNALAGTAVFHFERAA